MQVIGVEIILVVGQILIFSCPSVFHICLPEDERTPTDAVGRREHQPVSLVRDDTNQYSCMKHSNILIGKKNNLK